MTPSIEPIQLGALNAWRVRRGQQELIIAEQGAQILRYQQDEHALLWLSEEAAFNPKQGVRGGAPICWPWFGDLKRNPQALQAQHQSLAQAPFHGAARTLDWTLEYAQIEGSSAVLRLSLNSQEQPIADWPYQAKISCEIRLDERLQITLSNHNLGQTPLAISQALHSYFAVSDIRQVAVQGLDGCRYIETLEDWQMRQQQGALRFAGETDRIYLDVPNTLRLEDAGWQRTICLEATGSRSAVLWNPWIDKAQRLSDFAADAWQRMLCIETANIWDDCLELAPGASHSLHLSLWSEPHSRA